MDELGILLLVLLILGVPLALTIWLIARAVQARNRVEELSMRVGSLEIELFRLKNERAAARAVASEPASAPVASGQPPVEQPAPPAIEPTPPIPVPAFTSAAVPPPIPEAARAPAGPPPFRPAAEPPRFAPPPPPEPRPAINWEQFLGVKGFAWVGGFALFLGIVFLIKLSFERNWITPEMRVAFGFLIGIGLLTLGSWLHRKKQYLVGAQSLCATGVVILYAVTWSCRTIYHFRFFDTPQTFLLMVLITTAAFFLAVRLNALVVAVLGMVGGFLTPILVSTGQDHPFGLFSYIAILDIGLVLVALNRRWFFLTVLAALGTVILQIGWAEKFFVRERYFEGNKIFIVLGVLLAFNVLYLAATWWTRRRGEHNRWLSGSALGLAAVALGFTAGFLTFAPLAARPWLMFGFVFLIDLAVIALVLLDDEIAPAQPLAGLGVFALLAFWTARSLSNDLLHAGLAFYFIFAVLHSVFPVLWQRKRGVTTMLWGSQVFPPLALVLVLIPIFQLADLPFAVWPFVLLVDVLAIGLAALTLSILPVLVVLVLTLAATGALIFKVPVETLTGLSTSFLVLGAFAVFFVVAGVWFARRLKPDVLGGGLKADADLALPENLAAQLPVLSAVLPFLLLIMATLRLPLADPSPVFGLGLLLLVLLFGVAKLFSLDVMSAVGLGCIAALQATWHFSRFNLLAPTVPLMWYLGFYALFTLYPFLFRRQFRDKTVPWAVAALAGPAQFFLIYRLVKASYPNDLMGLLPLAFALPPLLSLVAVLKTIPAASPARLGQLAWFGGVALFFITLVFPIQFEKQWITIGWALEGAALLWLFHRVPHPGLRLTGVGLLIAAFIRLANPYVLEYHPRSATPILNWYLYTYGMVTVCLFVGARLLARPRHRALGINVLPLLYTLGTVLAFVLLNIEIADYFSDPGATSLFTRNLPPELAFARNMTYSIAWGLFALVLLGIGIWKEIRGCRYAALGLLSVTLLKLFFLDLANLNQLYRIGAFIGVAIIAILASFAYQRFFAVGVKEKDAKDEPMP